MKGLKTKLDLTNKKKILLSGLFLISTLSVLTVVAAGGNDFSGLCSLTENSSANTFVDSLLTLIGNLLFYGAPGLGIILGLSKVLSEAAEKQNLKLRKAKGPVIKGFFIPIGMTLLGVSGIAGSLNIDCMLGPIGGGGGGGTTPNNPPPDNVVFELVANFPVDVVVQLVGFF